MSQMPKVYVYVYKYEDSELSLIYKTNLVEQHSPRNKYL